MTDIMIDPARATWRGPTLMITRDDVLGHLRAVVAEAGEDYVYPVIDEDHTCWYVRDGEYDCIAARVFGRLGVPVGDLAQHEGWTAGAVVEWLDLCFTLEAEDALAVAQHQQDKGTTWGGALAAAEETVG